MIGQKGVYVKRENVNKKPPILAVICLTYVDLVSQNWNQLHSLVFEASEAILGTSLQKNSFICE